MRIEDPHALPPGPGPRGNGTRLHLYGSVLSHAEHLGDDESPPVREASGRRLQRFLRPLAGLGVACAAVPVLSLVWHGQPREFAAAFLVAAVSAVIGVGLGHTLTRREFSAWARSFTRRTERIFRGELDLADDPREDLGSTLEKVTRSIERSLGAGVRSERDGFISTITSLVSALEARDPYTRNHSASVAKLAVRIGRRMGLDREELYEIHLGGLLHDLGKIGIRDEILLKPAGLTRDEYEIMKTHPVLGARILSGLPGLGTVAAIVLHHHEMFDGRGYPDGLAGEDIPLGARIIAVADTYLSLVEHRPYREGRRLDRAVAEIQRVRGRQLDPGATDALIALIEEEEEREEARGEPANGNGREEAPTASAGVSEDRRAA